MSLQDYPLRTNAVDSPQGPVQVCPGIGTLNILCPLAWLAFKGGRSQGEAKAIQHHGFSRF